MKIYNPRFDREAAASTPSSNTGIRRSHLLSLLMVHYDWVKYIYTFSPHMEIKRCHWPSVNCLTCDLLRDISRFPLLKSVQWLLFPLTFIAQKTIKLIGTSSYSKPWCYIWNTSANTVLYCILMNCTLLYSSTWSSWTDQAWHQRVKGMKRKRTCQLS